ncbi:DNA ligase 1-like [Sinocyclocheilus rhinocerous]|uniref:DNA ligase 1-like n=1 Tax=Sinocyclocheilus rhinocerous TaxID=307959 RepID=UPI0007B932F8|nr:PREDICTED: DNA ligase 1-like [Sinocyclocheilus rhinocerous]
MAAWVGATTREMGQSLINPDKPSVSASALPGDTGKPALRPKPHLMPKPFALQRNSTVRPIRAPKTNFSRELHRAASSEALLDIKKAGAGGPNLSESQKSGSNGTVNGSNQIAAPKPVPLGPKPDLLAKPKPEPTKSPGSNNQTGPNSKPAVTAEDVKDVQPRSRAKSLGSLDQKILNQKDQGEAAKTEADVKVSSRCWPPRNRLSVELTSKFESPSQPEKEVRRDAETSKMEKEWPPHSPSESKPSKLPVDTGEMGDEDVSGGSIKRRISLLFDRSTAAQRRDTSDKRDNTASEISVDPSADSFIKVPPSEKTPNERSSEKPAATEKVPVDKPPSMAEIKNSAASVENVEEEEDHEDEEEDYVLVPVYRRLGTSLDVETKRREEEEKQRKDEQLEKERQQRERERLLEEERKAREIERQKEEQRKRAEEERKQEEEKQRQMEEKRKLKKEKEMEEERRRTQEIERQKEEKRLRKERELERLKKEKEMEEERRRTQEIERLKEEEKRRQEREHEMEMETCEAAERLREEVPTSYDLISFDASQTLVSTVQPADVSPRLTQVTYDDFSVKPRRWGTRARRSSTLSPSRETPAAPDHNLQPESKSSHPGPQEPSGDQVSVHDLIGFESEASSPHNSTESRKHTYLFKAETESKPGDLLEPETDEGQLKDGEPEEDGVAEQDTENLIGETDEQTENNDTVDDVVELLTKTSNATDFSVSVAFPATSHFHFPLCQSAAPLLDSSVFRSKVDLGKKRSIKRSRPSRAVRQRAVLPALTEGTQPDWRFCDSTDAKDQCSNGADSESEEEPSRDVTSSPAPNQPKRVPVFPGMDPSALMAQLKRRSAVIETESPTEAVPSRSPRTPTMALGPRVLPPVDAKDSGSGSSPSWLLELKSKKRMSQPESEA